MKLVIDIPEEDYEYIKNSNDMNFNAIKNGTPLKEELEDIKAEIEDLDTFFDNDYFSGNNDAMFKKKDVLAIIDKHISRKE